MLLPRMLGLRAIVSPYLLIYGHNVSADVQ